MLVSVNLKPLTELEETLVRLILHNSPLSGLIAKNCFLCDTISFSLIQAMPVVINVAWLLASTDSS
jgi:hypothetical protein